jgi:hypothetical protein
VIDSKIKLTDLGDLTLSTRPALLMGGYDTEWRLPFTVEGQKNARGFVLFGEGCLHLGVGLKVSSRCPRGLGAIPGP